MTAVATRTIDIPISRAYVPFLEDSRYKGAHGGRGSAKSHEFANLLIDRCVSRPGTRWICVREIQKSLAQSVKRLLEDKIKAHGVADLFTSTLSHINTPGGGMIAFTGMQNHTAESIKSLEGFDGAWIEEAQSLSDRSLTLLRPTIRKEGSEIWATWNPRYEADPIDVLLRGKNPPPNAIVLGTSWRDNPWFPQPLRLEMEYDRRADPEKYEHVWGGGYEKNSEARVFKNWTVDDFETPADAIFRYGGDWGFSVDPTCAVRVFLESELSWEARKAMAPGTHVKRRLYIDREVYKIGCEIDHIPDLFDQLDGGQAREWPLVADSARPETISYLRRHGYPRLEPAVKGPNSVKEGVIFLQSFEIIIKPGLVHTEDEFRAYSYVKDPDTGRVTPVLADKKNHFIDSIRYATEAAMRARAPGDWGITI